MTRVYRSPRSGSAAAATTPARLAREFGGQVRWRERPSGEIEVAILRDGRVDRCLVDEDGSTTLLASSPPSSASLWGKPVCIAGFLLCLATIIVLGASDPDGKGSHAGGLLVFLAGMALAAIGGIAGAKADDLSSRLNKLQVGKDEWHEPTNLRDWLPRSSEQLSAVERIADEHGGLAFVHDVGARTTDVCAMRKGRFERYWVDEIGTTKLAETKPPHARHFANRALCATTAVALLIGLVLVGFRVQHDKGLMFLVLFGALTATGLTAWANEGANSLERRVKQLADDGYAWIEIRTRVEETD